MLTKLLPLFSLCSALSTPSRSFLRFSEVNTETTIKPCYLLEPVEKDSFGREWRRFCYVHDNGVEEVVEFRREYTVDGWTYYVNQQFGFPTYDYRQVENILHCESQEREVDGSGRDWLRWCYTDSSPVDFEKQGQTQWTYVEDHRGGCEKCEWRRILHPSQQCTHQAEEQSQEGGAEQQTPEVVG